MSLAAAALGIFSLLLPWVHVSASQGYAYAVTGESPWQLLSSFLGPTSPSGPVDPAILAWEQSAASGYALWVIGSVTFILGCLLAITQTFESIRWAGVPMLGGCVLSAVGINSFSGAFSTASGVKLAVGSEYGLYVAVFACLIGFVPFVVRREEDRWVRAPRRFSSDVGSRFTPPAPFVLGPPASSPTPGPAETAPGAGPILSSGPSPPTAGPLRLICPECGQPSVRDERACLRDGTLLKPVSPLGETEAVGASNREA